MKKALVFTTLLLASAAAQAGPDNCARISVEHDEGDRFELTLNNSCSQTVYVSYCYTHTSGANWNGRESAAPGRIERDGFHARSGHIKYRLGWSFGDALITDC